MLETVYVGNAGADAPESRGWLLGYFKSHDDPRHSDRTVLLAEQGDYVVFHRFSHSWYAEEASVVVAVRWPSVPGYSADQDQENADA